MLCSLEESNLRFGAKRLRISFMYNATFYDKNTNQNTAKKPIEIAQKHAIKLHENAQHSYTYQKKWYLYSVKTQICVLKQFFSTSKRCIEMHF